ncbi:general secretion pathway protein GspB [Echinimonas agarilytica]|uniref:General secretion pathway protein GspB n=1 Tax=Echinimonas agarilytica TaxID=1215918 RepID=A0AA42B8D0_9GAMM|nr:general secretion pathway protein GspB [Echinimonas agarilytica]MCM2680378.1 general secretion pathway protein GspB [Echinimonas agarilytica]
MSYILDALKRNASDAEVGHVPSIHTQSGVASKASAQRFVWPIVSLALVVAAIASALILQPWNRQSPEAEVIVADVPPTDVELLGSVDYSQYPARAKVVIAAVRVPQPETHTQPLPSSPVSAGIANGERKAQAIVEPKVDHDSDLDRGTGEAKRLSGSELEALFNQAVSATISDNPKSMVRQDYQSVEPLTRKPQSYQNQVPSMNFNAHSYSSDVQKRMIKVNGSELREGDWIGNDVQVQAILPDRVILEMQGQQFTLPALTDW